MCSCKFGRVGDSGSGLITSYFIQSLIVLKIFVKLSKWQVPQDGLVMRLQSQWVDVLGALVWSVNTFIDWSLWAECWAGPTCVCSMNWYWMSMKRKPWNVTNTLCWDCHSTEYLSEDNWPKTWERRRCGSLCILLCMYSFLKGKPPKLFLKVSKE